MNRRNVLLAMIVCPISLLTKKNHNPALVRPKYLGRGWYTVKPWTVEPWVENLRKHMIKKMEEQTGE